MLAGLIQGVGIGGQTENPQAKNFPAYAIKLTGYDTRDANDLLGIATLDNKFDQKVCTVGCSTTPNNIPQNSGTEFAVLQIKNTSHATVYLEGIQINNVLHTWDIDTGGKTLDASVNDFTGKYPQNGKFSILSMSGLVQQSDNTLVEDQEVRLVVKLGAGMNADLSIAKPMLVQVDFGGTKTSDSVILSGEIR